MGKRCVIFTDLSMKGTILPALRGNNSYKKRDLHTQTTGWWTSSLEFILENISLVQDVSHTYVFLYTNPRNVI
jgi:hypothetical protein